jgi:hypothetical protein
MKLGREGPTKNPKISKLPFTNNPQNFSSTQKIELTI